MTKSKTTTIIAFLLCASSSAFAWSETTSNKPGVEQQTVTVGKKSMGWAKSSDDRGCDTAKVTGKIVKRNIGEDGEYINSVVIETRDGRLETVQMPYSDYFDFNTVTRTKVLELLYSYTKIGRTVTMDTAVCGSGGYYHMKGIQ